MDAIDASLVLVLVLVSRENAIVLAEERGNMLWDSGF